MDERQIIEDIVDAYNSKDVEKLKQYLKEGYCSIKDKKLIINKKYIDIVKKAAVYWDEQQYVRKISLNSLYGALLNQFMRFFDQRIGQSTTLTGRNITKHMGSYINQILTGKYDNIGDAIVYGDTDSVDGDSIIKTSNGDMTIEELFLAGSQFYTEGEKEYSLRSGFDIFNYDHNARTINYGPYNYVYRHKVSKKRFKITDALGNDVIVTEDHSVMVLDEQGNLVEKKPKDLKVGDKVISLN